MSAADLGHSMGPIAYGRIADSPTYVLNYLLLGAFVFTVILAVFFHRESNTEVS